MIFRTAELVGRSEHGTGEDALTRLLTPLTKLACARQGVNACSELIESFGGAGYLEDTGIPRILRNTHVHCIWEGTTTVMAHDVLRALRAEDGAQAFLADAEAHTRAFDHPLTSDASRRVLAAIEELRPMLAAPEEGSGRRLAWAGHRVGCGAGFGCSSR